MAMAFSTDRNLERLPSSTVCDRSHSNKEGGSKDLRLEQSYELWPSDRLDCLIVDTYNEPYSREDFGYRDVGKLEEHVLIDLNEMGILSSIGGVGMQDVGEDWAHSFEIGLRRPGQPSEARLSKHRSILGTQSERTDLHHRVLEKVGG